MHDAARAWANAAAMSALRVTRSFVRRDADIVVCIVVPLAVYLSTMRWFPDVWDAGEMQTVPYMLGITHVTGFPLFVLAGWLFAHAVPLSTVAWRMNLFCALAIVASILCLRALAIGFGAQRYVASLAALAYGLTGVVWIRAIHADVHALALALILGAIVALQRALTHYSVGALVSASALTGCALAVHLNAIYVAPFVLVTAIVLRDRLTVRDWLRGLVAFVVPLLTYAYLPIRSQMIVAQHLDPTAGLALDGTYGVDWGPFPVNSIDGFWRMVSGDGLVRYFAGLALDPHLWPGFALDWLTRTNAEISLGIFVVALAGCAAVVRRMPLQLIAIVPTFLAIPYAIAFAPVETDVFRYLLPSLAVAIALAAAAPLFLPAGFFRRGAWIAVGAMFAVVAVSEYATHRTVRSFVVTRANQDAIDIVHERVPDGAVVLSSWNDLTTLGYGKYIEGVLGSRLIIGGWPSDSLGTLRTLAQTHRVYVLADPVMQKNLTAGVPAPWQHVEGYWPERGFVPARLLVRIVPPS